MPLPYRTKLPCSQYCLLPILCNLSHFHCFLPKSLCKEKGYLVFSAERPFITLQCKNETKPCMDQENTFPVTQFPKSLWKWAEISFSGLCCLKQFWIRCPFCACAQTMANPGGLWQSAVNVLPCWCLASSGPIPSSCSPFLRTTTYFFPLAVAAPFVGWNLACGIR